MTFQKRNSSARLTGRKARMFVGIACCCATLAMLSFATRTILASVMFQMKTYNTITMRSKSSQKEKVIYA